MILPTNILEESESEKSQKTSPIEAKFPGADIPSMAAYIAKERKKKKKKGEE